MSPTLFRGCFHQPAVDPGDLLRPALPVGVLEGQDLVQRPVEVVGDVGYLLEQPVEGVAYDPPRRTTSTSNSCWQPGQATGTSVVPFSLIRR